MGQDWNVTMACSRSESLSSTRNRRILRVLAGLTLGFFFMPSHGPGTAAHAHQAVRCLPYIPHTLHLYLPLSLRI